MGDEFGCGPRPVRPGVSALTTVGAMLSAWVLITLTSLAAAGCGYGAYRLARRPRGSRR